MNERIKLLAEHADAYADAMDYLGKNYIGLRDTYFAELIAQECLKDIETAALETSCEDWEDWEYGHNAALNKAKELIVNRFEVEE